MSCIICNKSEEIGIYRGLTQCKNCGLIYYLPHKKEISLTKLYDENYFNGNEYFDYKNDKEIIQKNFNYRLKEITKNIKNGKLFEIGSAYGFFLDVAKSNFNVSGIDITQGPTKWAREKLNLKVITGDYLKTHIPKKDIFCMWDTIEHLEKPDKFIKKISSELNTDGYLFLTTGDISSLMAKINGKNWRLIHPPTHLFYFSKSTITKLLEKYGFQVISITHPGIYRSLKQIFYSLFFLNQNHAITKSGKFLTNLEIPIYLNTFDIMMVTAKKL